MDGIINIYKEPGFTSHDVVAKLRGILRQRKIGHTGTLDPMAEGVLPVCLGNATRVSGMLTDTDKEYRVVFRLGVATDTQDMTGTVISEAQPETDEVRIRAAVMAMCGDIDQIPPMYSAVKVGGRRLYSIAREGGVAERAARRIHIYGIIIHSIDTPLVEMTVTCSKGTYVRTICHDIGQALGCGAAMEKLTRLRSGIFEIGQSLKLAEIERLAADGRVEEAVVPVESLFLDIPVLTCRPEADRLLLNGNKIAPEGFDGTASSSAGRVRVHASSGRFTAIYEYIPEENAYRPVKMFM